MSLPRRRVSTLSVLVIIGFVIISSRLMWLQGIQYRDYQVREESRRHAMRLLPAPRGRILSDRGEILAENAPRHYLVYNLTEIEQARRVAIRLSKLVRNWGRSRVPLLEAETVVTSFEQLRHWVRPLLGTEREIHPHRWIHGLDRDLARYLRARISKRPDRYPGLSVEVTETEGIIWVDPAELFRGEATTRRVERWLGMEPGTLYLGRERDGSGGVWAQYTKARAIDSQRRRQDHFDRERTLLRSVPFELVVHMNYYPEQFWGVHVREGHLRRYPAGLELAHIIGQAGWIDEARYHQLKTQGLLLDRLRGLDDAAVFLSLRKGGRLTTSLAGRSGLELRFDDTLSGTPGARFVQLSGRGQEVGDPTEVVEPIAGRDVVLTIDLEFSRAIRAILEEQNVVSGSVLVAEPVSGRILGWVSHPSFDPQTLSQDYDALVEQKLLSPLLDRPSRFALPPGSTIKPAVALAGLAEGVVTRDSPFTCEGLYDRRFPDRLRCRNHHLPMELEVEDALALSCNCYFYHLGARALGLHPFFNRLSSFGFARPTGVPIGESIGSLPVEPWGLTSASIGQGTLEATPLQLLRFMCLLANRTYLPVPRILADQPLEYEIPDGVERADVEAVVQGMRQAVTEGSASHAWIGLRPFDCAVKTGTADRFKEPGACELCGDRECNIAWLVGCAPTAEPEVVFVIEVEHTELHGGEGAGPVAREILAWLREHRGLTLNETLAEDER